MDCLQRFHECFSAVGLAVGILRVVFWLERVLQGIMQVFTAVSLVSFRVSEFRF